MPDLPRETWVGRRPMAGVATHHQYAELTSPIGVRLSLHDSWDAPGEFWLTSTNHAGDYRPIRLDLDQVRALHEATGLILAGLGASTTTEPVNVAESVTHFS